MRAGGAMVGPKIGRAKEFQKNETEAESFPWDLLRGKQLCGLEFRLQPPLDPFYADFTCGCEKLVSELDGGYHNHTPEQDLER